MILINDDKISSISVNSENNNYPKENLLDSDAKNPWRAMAMTAYLQVSVNSGCTTLGLFGISGPTSAMIVFRDSGLNPLSITPDTSFFTPFLNRLILNWDNPDVARIDITMFGGTTVEASILRAGAGTVFPNMSYGMSNSSIEHSVMHLYKTGGAYFRDRGRSRIQSGSLRLSLAESLALKEIVAEYGPSPLAVVFEGDSIQGYSLFGGLAMGGAPTESRDMPNHVNVSLTVTEFI